MQTLTQTFPIPYIQQEDSSCDETILLLDIETTGFSADMSTIFMIGCAHFDGKKMLVNQWLSDTLELRGEQEVLNAFSEWLLLQTSSSKKLCLVTYNGDNFDLPFLKNRYAQCQLSCPLNSLNLKTLDLYRKFLPLKTLWPVKNMKLKTMSIWLGYTPLTTPSGRQLIKSYHQYIKIKDSETLNLLFLHNTDDLRALAALLPVYNYICFFNGSYTVSSADCIEESLLFHLTPEVFLPAPLTFEACSCRIDINETEALLRVPIYERGLRYYYSDIKNYIYLPEEDYALHKSMAAYIDKSHWQKATRENCYTWFCLEETFLTDRQRMKDYVQMIFRLLGFLR